MPLEESPGPKLGLTSSMTQCHEGQDIPLNYQGCKLLKLPVRYRLLPCGLCSARSPAAAGATACAAACSASWASSS